MNEKEHKELDGASRRPETIILEPWDWRYHVGYDSVMRERILGAISALPKDARQDLLHDIFDWACSFVSLDALIARDQTVELLQTRLEELDRSKIIPFTASDAEYYVEEVARRFGNDTHTEKVLRSLVVVEKEAQFQNLDRLFFSIIFSEAQLETFDLLASNAQKPNIPKFRTIKAEEFRTQVERFVEDRKSASCVEGQNLIDFENFDLVYEESDAGYAEYWPKSLTGGERNKLIVYENEWTRDALELEGTLKHEIYPGHGLFYAMIDSIGPRVIDHSATVLIEGWATYAEWLEAQTPYNKYTRYRAMQYISLLKCSSEDEFTELLEAISMDSIKPIPFDRLRRQYRQYPGLSLSYILGALWFEQHVNSRKPIEFLQTLLKDGVGDFFKLWSNADITSPTAVKEQVQN